MTGRGPVVRALPLRAWLLLTAFAVTAVVVAVDSVGDARAPQSITAGATSAQAPEPGTATDAIESAAPEPEPARGSSILAGVPVVPARPSAPEPYRRARFGDSWTDQQGALLGRNGCDTRNDILDRDLRDKTYVRTSGCRTAVSTGFLIDPYSGSTIAFTRGPQTSADVQIDHIVPLAYAWDMGAWSWSDDDRTRFANDPHNLVAVDGPANQNKGDSPPGRWMPSNEGFHCQYVEQFASVTSAYALTIDSGSAAVIEQVAAGCD